MSFQIGTLLLMLLLVLTDGAFVSTEAAHAYPVLKPNNSQNNIQGTLGDRAPYSNGCNIPTAEYAILDSIYLGEQAELGDLKWKPGLCGQVFDVNCGHGTIKAVVKDRCRLHFGGLCGIGFTQQSWNRATNGLDGSQTTSCTVSLTTTNPFVGDEPVCYHSPYGSDDKTYMFLDINVYNTNGRVAVAAIIDGMIGYRPDYSAYFSFHRVQPGTGGLGTIPFESDSVVLFQFDSGPDVQFRLRDCKRSRG